MNFFTIEFFVITLAIIFFSTGSVFHLIAIQEWFANWRERRSQMQAKKYGTSDTIEQGDHHA